MHPELAVAAAMVLLLIINGLLHISISNQAHENCEYHLQLTGRNVRNILFHTAIILALSVAILVLLSIRSNRAAHLDNLTVYSVALTILLRVSQDCCHRSMSKADVLQACVLWTICAMPVKTSVQVQFKEPYFIPNSHYPFPETYHQIVAATFLFSIALLAAGYVLYVRLVHTLPGALLFAFAIFVFHLLPCVLSIVFLFHRDHRYRGWPALTNFAVLVSFIILIKIRSTEFFFAVRSFALYRRLPLLTSAVRICHRLAKQFLSCMRDSLGYMEKKTRFPGFRQHSPSLTRAISPTTRCCYCSSRRYSVRPTRHSRRRATKFNRYPHRWRNPAKRLRWRH